MPVYYSKLEEEQPIFHVFLGCSEGSKIAMEDRVEKLKKRAVCQECLVLMKQSSWVVDPHESHDHDEIFDPNDIFDHEEIFRTGS